MHPEEIIRGGLRHDRGQRCAGTIYAETRVIPMATASHRFKILCALIAVLILVALAWRFLDRPRTPVTVGGGIESDEVAESRQVPRDGEREKPLELAPVPDPQSEPSDSDKAAKVPARALFGIVTDRGGWPIVNVGIYARFEDETPSATTDRWGRFEIENLRARSKNQHVYARHPSYRNGSVPIGTAVETGQVLAITLKKGATVRGEVTFLGRPVADQEVKVVRMDLVGLFGSGKRNTRTGADGAYELFTVEPGTIQVTAYFQPDDEESSPRSMRIGLDIEDDETRVIDFDFRARDATLEGQVLFNGEPVPNAEVNAVSRSLSEAGESFREQTDSEGSYRFEALPSGVLEVQVEVEVGATEHMRGSTIELPAGFVSTSDFSLGGTGVITGYCTGREDYRNSVVMLMASEFSDLFEEQGIYRTFALLDVEHPFGAGTTVLSSDGSFRLEGLEAGTYAMLTLVNVDLSGRVDYAFTSVTVSESQETHVVLGPDYLTEYEPEED